MAKRKKKSMATIKKNIKEIKEKEKEVLNRLPKELYLEIRLNHLEMDGLKKDLSNVGLMIENAERAKALSNLRKDDIRNKIKVLGMKHEQFLEIVKKKTGIDIKNKTINPETLEVI